MKANFVKTKVVFPLSVWALIIIIFFYCTFGEAGKKLFPQIPISLFKMEITAIRCSRCPLIKINGGRKEECGKHRQAILPLRELDSFGGWSEAR